MPKRKRVAPKRAKQKTKKRSVSSESIEVLIGGKKAKPLPIGVDSNGKVGLIDQTGEKSNSPTEP